MSARGTAKQSARTEIFCRLERGPREATMLNPQRACPILIAVVMLAGTAIGQKRPADTSPAKSGKGNSEAFAAEMQRSVNAGAHDYVVHSLHAERSGDVGYDTGAYNVTLRNRVVEGNYLVVVKRIDGRWKI